jgi:hypothetical protein
MSKRRFNNGRLYCFSPQVMAATFMLESLLALYVLFRYKTSTVTRLAVAMLACLATFQLAEYIVCQQSSLFWSRIGYAAITMLPPLGLHLAYTLDRRTDSKMIHMAYAVGVTIAVVFGLVPTSINSAVCTGNYVIFKVIQPYSFIYGTYYLGLLAYTISFVVYKRHYSFAQPSMRWLVYGYLAFIIPSGLISANWGQARDAMPSIMCGFALIFAFFLTAKVLGMAPNESENENYLTFTKRVQNKFRSLYPRI